jgi:hypothetical protein
VGEALALVASGLAHEIGQHTAVNQAEIIEVMKQTFDEAISLEQVVK